MFYGNWRGQRDLRTDRVLRCGNGAEEEHARPERDGRMHFRRPERAYKSMVARITLVKREELDLSLFANPSNIRTEIQFHTR